MFWKISTTICKSCGDIYWHSYESFSALQSTSIPLIDVENSAKLIRNWRCYPSSKCCKTDQKTLFWIGRSAVAAQRKTAILVHNYTPSGVENLLPVWLLMHTNMFVPSHFWTTFTNFDTCFCCYISTCGKFLYRCTSTFHSGILLKYFCYLYEVVRTNFSTEFSTKQFLIAILQKLWLHLATKMRTI